MRNPHTRQRSRRRRLWICGGLLLGAWLATTPVAAQDLAPEAPLQRPDPAALTAGWWRWFDVTGEELEKRTQEVSAALKKLPEEISETQREALLPSMERAILNLQALPAARAASPVEAPPPRPIADEYTIDEWLEIDTRLRLARAESEQLAQESRTEAEAIRLAHRSVDARMATYLTKAPTERLRLGLQILAERSAIGVAEERSRLRRAAIAAADRNAESLAVESDKASHRLQASPEDLARLAAAIDSTAEALEKSETAARRADSDALGAEGDDPRGRAERRRRMQAATRAQVTAGAARVAHITARAEHQLAGLLRGSAGGDTAALRDEVAAWRATLDQVESELSTWVATSERERARAAEALAAIPDDANADQRRFAQTHRDRIRVAQETLLAAEKLRAQLARTRSVLDLADLKLAARQSRLRRWWRGIQGGVGSSWGLASDWFGARLFLIGDTPVTTFGLLRVALILTIAWWFSWGLRRTLNRIGARRDAYQPAFYTVGRLAHYAILLAAFVVALSSIGLDFSNFAIFAGALGVGIGFGLQSIISNFVSGLILLFERNLKIGDFVELPSGVFGEVKEISVRSTLVKTNDDVDLVVPNSEFISGTVVNWTLHEATRRVHVPFGVAYGTNKELVRDSVLAAADKVPHTLRHEKGREPHVWLVGFGDSSLDFELVVWINRAAVKRPGAVQAAYLWAIETALGEAGIEIPFPQRDLHLRSPKGWVEELSKGSSEKGPGKS